MEEDEQRTVFNANLVLDRKAVITAVAIDHEGSRVFLGLEEGMLEEYSLENVDTSPICSLTARKPIAAKQPIISILPATSANCLALLIGDGSLRLVHSDTLENRVALKGPILAAAVALPTPSTTISLPRIAVVTRLTMSRALRVSVYDILSAGGQIPSLKHIWEVDVGAGAGGVGGVCVAWAGESVILGSGSKYFITWQKNLVGAWRDLLSIEEESTTTGSGGSGGNSTSGLGDAVASSTAPAVSAVSLPRQACAFLCVGSLGLVVSPAGEPRGNPVLFQNMRAVRAVASGEGVIAVVCEDGICIADPSTGKWIQGLGFGQNMLPAPGQPLRASGGGGSDSSVAVVAGRHKVWALTPIPVLDQAKDMLSRRDFAGALKIAAKGLAEGKIWAEEAYAQTALLLMHEGRFLEALVALEHCSPTAFQPAELFPLFPQHTKPWEPHPSPLHWSLNGPLEPLETMISKSPLLRRQRHRHQGTSFSSTTTTIASTAADRNGSNEVVAEERLREAKQAIVQYLFRARVLPGVLTLEGVDTLLMHLLIDIDAAQEAAAFAAVVPHAIRPEFVAERLEIVGWRHALATLWASAGNVAPALKIWKELSDSEVSNNTNTEIHVRERKEAIHGVASLLQSQHSCPDSQLVLSYIPWLLNVSPTDASHVLSSRQDLKPQEILPLLPLGEETRWRYLEHLVQLDSIREKEKERTEETTAVPSDDLPASNLTGDIVDDAVFNTDSMHTELAKALIAAIFKAAPELAEPPPRDLRGGGGGGSSDDAKVERQQRANAVARHRSVLPMELPQNSSSSTPPLPPLSVAALVSGMRSPDPEEATDPLEALRFRLRSHLETSSKVNHTQILSSLQGSSLLEEQAVVYWRQGNHKSVLRVLAVLLRDVNAAVCYASVYLPPEDHRMLLYLLLNPENDREQQPRWEDACRVVALLGNSLDSLEVVRAAPEGMPMPAAVALMAPLIRERVHRRRNGQLTAALHRSRAAAGAVSLAAVEEQNVVIDEGRACPDCHLRLGGKVFVVVQQQNINIGKTQHAQQQQQQQQQPSMPPKAFCLSCWNKRQKASSSSHNDI